MTTRNPAVENIEKVRDTIAGLAAAGAAAAGWDVETAAQLGVKAQEGAMSRIAVGQSVEEALSAAIIEAEMIVMLDVFSRTLDQRFDLFAAFEKAIAVKRRTLAGAPFAEATIQAAENAFRTGLQSDLAPQAAFASAYMAAASVARLAMAKPGKH